MKRINIFVFVFIASLFMSNSVFAQKKGNIWQVRKTKDGKTVVINTAADKLSYWMKLAKQGVVPYNKDIKVADGKYLGSTIKSSIASFDDSPDITTHDGDDHTQSEVSVFVNPNNNLHVFNSNNSTQWSGGSVGSLYGTSGLYSDDGGESWYGTEESTGGDNSGDPAAAIDLNGRMFSGFIHSNGGQGVAYSDDNGTTWTSVLVASPAGGFGSLLDKNHMIVDNSPTSSYAGNVYTAWTDFGGAVSESEICLSYSDDGGETYSTPVDISSDVNAGSHCQGVNIQTGPNGEVYAVWTIYDDWASYGYEEAMGINVSYDGGATWEGAHRIIENIHGIRDAQPTAHRVNSFPSMAVNQQTGEIFVVWANYGVPGTNTGTNASVYMIKSADEGETWSTPIRVNQNDFDEGEASYLPWMSCDPSTGTLSVIFYDTRNTTGNDVETWVAVSMDEGETWEDFRVGDVSFTTQAIPGLAADYMGDYLGIASLDAMVYPVWSDNRDGIFKSYTSPFSVNMRARVENLDAEITDTQIGQVDLTWEYSDEKAMEHFIIYKDNEEIGTTTDLFYTDYLPDFGTYKYSVSVMHEDGESSKVHDNVLWGAPIIYSNPDALSKTLAQNQLAIEHLTITNNGQLDLTYNLITEITSKYGNLIYCDATGGGDEYISGVVIGSINNTGTGEDDYTDYTSLSTDVSGGDTYDITITNGNSYSSDDIGIWVDWNQDGDFDDDNENIVCEADCGGEGTFSFTVPTEASAGSTTMRIRLKYSGTDCGSPCGSTTYGEVEDYTLNVNNWLEFSSTEGTVAPGATEIIEVTFSSYELEVGTYNANLTIESNDAENSEISVPVSLEVTGDFAVSPIAAPQNICSGSQTQLFANAGGGTGSYTYSWSSDIGSFTSDEENPYVNPEQTTTYTVEVNDGESTLTGSVIVNIFEDIEQASKPYGDDFVGNYEVNAYITNELPNATTYEWQLSPSDAGVIASSTTEATVNWNNNFVGTATISVRGLNDCTEGDWSNELVVEVSEVASVKENNNISLEVYPNPSTGKFILSYYSDLEDFINIQVFDMSGKVVYSELNKYAVANNSMFIDLTGMPSGIYVINVSGEFVNENIKVIID